MSFWRGELLKLIAKLKELETNFNAFPSADLNMHGFSITNANALVSKSGLIQNTGNATLTFSNTSRPGAAAIAQNTGGDLYVIYDSAATTGLKFATATTAGILNGTYAGVVDRMSLDINGLLTLPFGQIAFPSTQNVSAGANVLDDYEKLTYTPALTFGGAAVGMTYTRRGGWYTKVGNLVVGGFEILLSAKGSSTGTALISLPFTTDATASHYSSTSIWAVSMTGLTSPIQQLIPNSSSTMQLGQWGAAGVTQITDTVFTATSRLGGGFAFHV